MDYVLYQSEFIPNNHQMILDDIKIAHDFFLKEFPGLNSTDAYSKYNIFSLTAPSTSFYQIYVELRNLVRSQLGETRPLWFQAWINHHSPLEVLNWHHHEFDYHGYISIDPKNTITEFEGYSIENKIGQFYFGPGYRKHRVIVNEDYQGPRLTIGFDIHTVPQQKFVKYHERPFMDMSLIPLL